MREAHTVGTDDWPVIRKLRDAGKLSYADDEVSQGMDEIARCGSTGDVRLTSKSGAKAYIA